MMTSIQSLARSSSKLDQIQMLIMIIIVAKKVKFHSVEEFFSKESFSGSKFISPETSFLLL